MRISLRSAGWLTGVVLTLVLAILWSATAAAGAEEGPGYDTPLYSYDASVDLAPSSIAALSAMETGADQSGIAVASAATARGRIYDSSADLVAPSGADDFIDLASPQRRTHILDGDATGGGHRWPGAEDKTPFPQGWADDQVMHHVSDIATDPSLSWNWTKGGPSGYTRAGDPGRASVFGVRDGVCIKVVVEPAGEGIITAHPSPGSC